jgi:altronate hydrolase
MKQKLIKVHPADNVLVALTYLSKGEVVSYNGEEFTLQDDIPAKHKFVTTDLEAGDTVEMYGVTVGKAQEHIAKGGIISTTNIKHAADPFFYRKTDFKWTAPDVSKFVNRTFNGYHRSNADVGTANYWLFVPTVFCENRNMDVIREALHNELGYAVTAKYKQYAHQLVEAFKKGEDISAIDLSPNNQNKAHRVFENVDGIKFLNH